MATTAIPLSEYLTTSYRPDCDYVDGEVQERNLGEKDHSYLQRFFTVWFEVRYSTLRMDAVPELRVQVSATRYRIPDVTVLGPGQTFHRVLREPALLMIEVLSPEDRLGRVRERVDDYTRMGVKHVWVVDPEKRVVYICDDGGFEQLMEDRLTIPRTEINIPLSEVWASLDR